MKRISKAWEDYRQFMLPKDAPEQTVEEYRIAFYGGATTLFNILIELENGFDGEITEKDCSVMDAILAELRTFPQDLIRHHVQKAFHKAMWTASQRKGDV